MCVNASIHCEILLYLLCFKIHIACEKQQRIIYFCNDEEGFNNNYRFTGGKILTAKVIN